MLPISRRHAHYLFGVIQSGLTSAVAAAIASYPFISAGGFVPHWLMTWLIAWVTVIPIVLVAAPAIRKLCEALTRDTPII